MEPTLEDLIDDLVEDIQLEELASLDEGEKWVVYDKKTGNIKKEFAKRKSAMDAAAKSDDLAHSDITYWHDHINPANKSKKDMNEEKEINSDEEFIEYVHNLLKKAHGEDFDKDKAQKTAEGILKKADGDYKAAIGALHGGLKEAACDDDSEEEKEEKEEEDIDEAKAAKPEELRSIITNHTDLLKKADDAEAKKFHSSAIANAKEKLKALGEAVEDDDSEEKEDDKKVEESTIEMTSPELQSLVESEEGLSEEFKEKAAVIFETALNEKVKAIKEEIEAKNEDQIAEKVEAIKNTLEEQVDDYLTYIAETWIESNKVAIETSLKTEIMEEFISGLKGLFESSYIEVPEEKVDLVEKLETEVASLRESKETAETELQTLSEQVKEMSKEKIVSELVEGLADTQVEKLKELTEDVDYIDDDQFRRKAEIIKEYFLGEDQLEKKQAINEKTTFTKVETVIEEEGHQNVSPEMQRILTAMSRLNKAGGTKSSV